MYKSRSRTKHTHLFITLPAACCFLFFLFITNSLAQQPRDDYAPSSLEKLSSVFTPPIEERIERSLDPFRHEGQVQLGASQLERLQAIHANDYPRSPELESLDLFGSLAAYYRDLPFKAEAKVDHLVENSIPSSRTAVNAALLGALEFYARSSLQRSDIEAGVARLNGIQNIDAAAPSVQTEVHFWKAEGYRELGELAPAEKEYLAALRSSNQRDLTATTDFRLAELLEYEGRYLEADSAFARVASIQESPLRLLALVRLGGVKRAEKDYTGVLRIMDSAEALFHVTPHVVRTSARDFRYVSPLLSELLTTPNVPQTEGPQMVSPFYISEIALLRGSAMVELGRYNEATGILTAGDEAIDGMRDSIAAGPFLVEQARFVSDAIRFERAWSLFEQAKYKEAAGAFLQLAVEDTGYHRHRLLRQSTITLREQGLYYDPFLNDSITLSNPPVLDRSVIAKTTVDTTFFLYNDFPERSRYYAGVALARAGMLSEAADELQKLTLDKTMLYSSEATYQLALIRFAEHSYEAQRLLEPLAYEESVRGGYASFLLGELAYRRGFYERAEVYFLNSFANIPRQDTEIRATAHLERGLSLIPLGAWKDAADELSTYISQSHEHIPGRTDEALFWLGKAEFRAGDYDSARMTFSRLLTEFPQSPRYIDATYTYAWSLFEANDFAAAEPLFERVIQLDSISRYAYDALARAGDSYYALGEMRSADRLYNLAVDRPAFNELRTTRALLMLGITRMKLDSVRSSMNQFLYITTKYPKSDIVDLAYFNAALAAYAINLTPDAEEIVRKIASQYPQSAVAPRALFVAGEERVRRGDARGALHYYEEVLNQYPRSREASSALFALQDALAELKRIPEALAVADTFVRRNPENPISPMVLLRAGEFRMKLHEAPAAIATFQDFISKYPTNPARPRAELLLGEAQFAAGNQPAAVIQLQTVITNYDSLDVAAQAHLDLARIERDNKSYDSAASEFQKAYQDKYYSADAAPQAMFEYAQMLAEQKKTDSAIDLFEQLATRYPIEASISARGLIRAGDILLAAHKMDRARSEYNKVVAAHPKDALGGAAMVRIGESYLVDGNANAAATSFTSAQKDFSLAVESDARALLGLARANVSRGKKADAVRDLHTLLSLRGAPSDVRGTAESMLLTLQPAPKVKTKKGAHKK